jgi:ABC-2 type transport system permease protein
MPPSRSSGAWERVRAIIGREFLERVRSKWFVAGTVLGPALMVALVSLPLLLARPDATARRVIVVVDAAEGEAGPRLVSLLNGAGLRATRVPVPATDVARVSDSLAGRADLGLLDGLLTLTDATVDSGRTAYRGSNVTSPTEMRLLEALVRAAVVGERWRRRGAGPDAVDGPPVVMTATALDDGPARDATATLFLAFGTWFLLYASIMLYGVQVMTSVVEEKTTRLAEVIFTSVRPFQALIGKIVGIGAVGLLQMTIWGLGAILLLAAARVRVPALSVSMVALALSYFLLGYLLYAALFGAVGAMVNSDAEARQAQIPIVVLLMVPSALMVGILAEPAGTVARVLSQVPFTSPIAMPVRIAAAGATAGEVATSLALLAVAVVAMVWVADRVYRTGVVTHGRRVSVKDVVKWVKG